MALFCEDLRSYVQCWFRGGVTHIAGLVYMSLPRLWANLHIMPGLWVTFCEFGPGYGSALHIFASVMSKC